MICISEDFPLGVGGSRSKINSVHHDDLSSLKTAMRFCQVEVD